MTRGQSKEPYSNDDSEALEKRLQEFVGKTYGAPRVGRDPVNLPMIRHLTDALGDRNPVYTDEDVAARSVHQGVVAPATSLQVWTMQGLAPPKPADSGDTQTEVTRVFDDAGFVGVVATNCEQIYHRYLRPGDHLTTTSVLESVSSLKRTALGDGHFLTTLQTYRDQHGEVVGQMRFRILKFRPRNRSSREESANSAGSAAPSSSADGVQPPTDALFFWEGVERDELRIQRCLECRTLRHPPAPACLECGAFPHDFVVASGRGEVYSYVVHHHPPVPGQEAPFVAAVIELAEGTRIVGNVLTEECSQVRIGMPVALTFEAGAEGRRLPQWRPIS